MAINKNSNAYIIIYTVVMVVIVGALLAFLATSLKDKQEAEVLKEQKFSIMRALGVANEDSDKNQMVAQFDDKQNGVTIAMVSNGKMQNVANDDKDAIKEVFDLLSDRKKLRERNDNLPIFQQGDTYVIPMVGKGLWDDIWGFVALQKSADNYIVTGIVMDHKGETPGLGAEIATTDVQKTFNGKKLYNEKNEIVVKMLKGGKENKEYLEGHSVDAITGGTKTCDGVNAMLATSIGKYSSFLLASQSVEPAQQPKEGCKECDKQCNEACNKNCEECENRKECCEECDKNCEECENRKECCAENCEETCEEHCNACCKAEANVESNNVEEE